MARPKSSPAARRARPARRTAAAPPRAPRVRRTPEAARELILGATAALLRELHPDAIGLKEIAARAGVSHALVTHYFGGIDGVIDASLERLAEQNREELMRRVAERPDEGPRAWLGQFFAWVMRPEAARLLAWSYLTGKTTRGDFFSRRTRGIKKMADLLEARFAGVLDVSRDEIEGVLLLVLSASFGYAVGRGGFWSGLGVDHPGPAEDARFEGVLANVVELLIATRQRPA